MTDTIYVGWIYADPDDRIKLQNLGVRGKMIWAYRNNSKSVTEGAAEKSGVMTHCECSEAVLNRLESEYPAFWRGSFSPLSREEHRKYRYENFGEHF